MSVMNAKSGKSALTPKKPKKVKVVVEVDPQTVKKDPFETVRDSDTYLSGKMIGGYVPQSTSQYFQLLALHRGQSIQKTLQQMMDDWCKSQEPSEGLTKELADRAFQEYKRRLIHVKKESQAPEEFLDQYLEEMATRLRRHRVTDPGYVSEIMGRLKGLIAYDGGR